MKKRQQHRKVVTAFLSLAALLLLASCATTKKETVADVVSDENCAVSVVIRDAGNQELKTRSVEKSDPQDVISHARNLAEAGRHGDAAKIFLAASKQFQSVGEEFEINCRKEAVRELYHNGDYEEADRVLATINHSQNIYGRTSESTCFKKLRKLVASKASAATQRRK